MIVLSFLLNLFGASMLLLFAVRLVRTGVERSFGRQLRDLLNSGGWGISAALSGCILAIMLQGATAVILMISGLVSAGVAELATGLAIAIGADIGSAIVVRVLTFDIAWLAPLLTALGGWLYLMSDSARLRNIGRTILGVALILFSLKLIGSAVTPIKNASFLPNISFYVERDLVLAFVIGIVFTFLLHSSVASILVCVALVDTQAISLLVGIAFVLGANISSALISVWLTRGSDINERHLPLLNLFVRGVAATIVFVLLVNFRDNLPLHNYADGFKGVIIAHLGFNVMLLGFLPFAGVLARTMQAWFPGPIDPDATSEKTRFISTVAAEKLDLGNPVSVLRRDVLSLLDSVSSMISESEKLINDHHEEAEQNVFQLEETVNETLNHVRNYFARSASDGIAKPKQKQMRHLLEYAVRLKHSGDILAKRIIPISREMRENQLSFSVQGRAELEELRCLALANTFLAFEVVSTWRPNSARDLVARKEEVARTEQKSKNRHFKRISSSGNRVSFETSNLHLELSAAYKEINSKIATIAYVILAGEGQLAQSRLLDDTEAELSS